MQYHKLINSSSGILCCAFNGDNLLYLLFQGKETTSTYEYEREDAGKLFASLQNCKPHAASLTDEERSELQKTLTWTIGSEGSYLLRILVGPRKEPFPNRRLSPDEAAAVWIGMVADAPILTASDDEAIPL